jgi:hypothetical protein
MKSYNFFMLSNVDEYIGKWVAIDNDKIIAVGENVKEVIQEAQLKIPKKRIFISKVPEKTAMIF